MVPLSSTFHWMCDRGLISIDDDYGLLLERDAIPSSVLGLVNRDSGSTGRIGGSWSTIASMCSKGEGDYMRG